MIEPIIAFAPGHVPRQVIKVIDRAKACIGMIRAIAPVGQRHVVIDADEIDILVRPERIKVEILIRRAAGLIAVIFRPIRGIADLAIRPQNGTYFACQLPQRCHRRKAVARPADLRQGHHL